MPPQEFLLVLFCLIDDEILALGRPRLRATQLRVRRRSLQQALPRPTRMPAWWEMPRR